MQAKNAIIVASALGAAGFIAVPAEAQSINDKYWLEASAYWSSVNSSAHVEPKNAVVPGTTIDFESDLDLSDSKAMPTVDAGMRLGSHWTLGLEYYTLSRKGNKTIGRDIVFDNDTFHAHADVASKFSSDIYRFTVGYAFVRKENFEIGAALGFHGTNFDLELAGDASVNGSPTVSSQVRRRKAFAPLPTIGLYGNFDVTPKVFINARADYLSLSIGDYRGRLLNTQGEISYRVMKNLDLGAMWRFVNYRLDIHKSAWEGQVKYKFSGPAISARLVF